MPGREDNYKGDKLPGGVYIEVPIEVPRKK